MKLEETKLNEERNTRRESLTRSGDAAKPVLSREDYSGSTWYQQVGERGKGGEMNA